MRLEHCAYELGRGLLAGAAGTAGMTVSSTLEMRMRGRAASDAPGRAAARLLRVRVEDDPATGRLAVAAHVMTGLSLGGVRGLLGCIGVREPLAAGAFLALAMLPDAAGLPIAGIAPPPWRWSREELAVSVAHHLVFAAVATAAYASLAGERRSRVATLPGSA